MPPRSATPAARRAAARPLAAALALALLLAPPLGAQGARAGGPPAVPPAAPPAPAFPDTPLGRAGAELLAVVNAGDSAAIARFVAERLGADGLRHRAPDVTARTLRLIHAQSGGLEPLRLFEQDGALRVMTRARNGRRLLGLELSPAPGDGARAVLTALVPMDESMMRPPAPWAEGPLDDAALAALLRARVGEAAAADRFAGVVLVARGDSVLLHEAYGPADAERARPNTRETTFQTTSLGKLFTGVAVAGLVERGLLRLDDTLARVLPDYPNAEAARRITIRQLLTHTAGVPEPFLSPRVAAVPADASHARLLAAFADAPHAAPDGAFRYSNGNYAVLGAVVERLTGTSFEAHLRRAVWEPAGMRRTAHAAWSAAPDRARPHARFSDTDPLGLDARRAAPAAPDTVRGALRAFGGGAYTAHDLFRFARALRAGRLVAPATADSLVLGRVAVGGAPVRYGFGAYEQLIGGRRVVGHRGSNPDTGWDADLEMLWDGEWTVVVLSNYDAPAAVQLAMPILEVLARQ